MRRVRWRPIAAGAASECVGQLRRLRFVDEPRSAAANHRLVALGEFRHSCFEHNQADNRRMCHWQLPGGGDRRRDHLRQRHVIGTDSGTDSRPDTQPGNQQYFITERAAASATAARRQLIGHASRGTSATVEAANGLHG
jgi:hypothetical protein